MNSYLDVAVNQRPLNIHSTKTLSDAKQLSPKLAHTPLRQQLNNTNHTITQPTQSNNHSKSTNRRKNTYQTNGKKRHFNGGQLAVNINADCRQYHRLTNQSNHDATLSGKKRDNFQTRDNFDSAQSTNTSSSVSSNSSEDSCEGNRDRNSVDKNSKSPAMDIRSTRLLISHPAAHQPHLSLLSPNAKTIYSVDYFHQFGAQIAEGFQLQQNDLFKSNGSVGTTVNRLTYANDRTNNSRYISNANNNSKFNNSKTNQNSNISVSPPLSITSSGSSTNSTKNTRATKSYNGNTMHSMNQHRIPTTPIIQKAPNAYFQTQNMPFFHNGTSNGMQQLFSSPISPNNQTHNSNQSVGLFVQQNSMANYHPNNNYNNHNRNYHGNNNKKNWHYYSKNKCELNGNYSSSNSSTTSSTNSNNSKTNLNKSSTTSLPLRNDINAIDHSIKKQSTDKLNGGKKLSNKSTQIESTTLSLKALSLSDSETSNPKLKQLPPSDYFRFAKAKATSSPVMNVLTPPILSGTNSPSLLIAHSFLSSNDKDITKLTANIENAYDKLDKNSFDHSALNVSNGQRSNYSLSSGYISTGSMLTEEMLLNGSANRLRFMNPQNMQMINESNVWPTNRLNAECYLGSPSRKNFQSNRTQQKRRLNIPLNIKQNEFEYHRLEMQYHSRFCDHNVPADLCNGSEWDQLSLKMWQMFDKKRQPFELYKQKIFLWSYLCDSIKTIFSRYTLYLVGSTVSGFALDSSDVDMCLVSRLTTTLDPRGEAVYHLDKLRTHLQQQCRSVLKNFHLIPAKVPILRFDDTHHNVEVDLNYNNCVGIRNSHLLYCYTQLDWRLQPLAIIVKLWAQHHDINNAKDLTISSYSLTLMVIHYLQCGVHPRILPCLHEEYPDKFKKINDINLINMNDKMGPYHSDNKQTLGELFFGFLQYYCNFSYEKYAISVRTASLLNIENCRNGTSYRNDPNDWKQLCIEEPFDHSNTARSCCDEKIFERIKKVFYESWLLLRETKDLDRLFSEALAPPALCAYYDNYTPLAYQPVDYIFR